MNHDVWMGFAVEQACEVMGTTAPNPSVGAVLVKDGKVVGAGCTQPVGGPHAEVMALRDAAARGNDPRGATLYVTLEPCRHVGRTPPCTRALIDAGVGAVVVGVVDPFLPMQGKGLQDLREHGIEVTLGVRADECEHVVRGFSRAVVHGLPEVTLKIATSLSGHIATHTGESQWITGPAARTDGHRMRAKHDGILVGIGTVLADDPRLTTRGVPGSDPVAVVLDSRLRIPDHARLLQRSDTLVICAEDAPDRELPVEVLRVPRGAGGVDVEAALRAVAAHGLHRILVEGGGQVARSLLDARLVDTVVAYVAGVAIPGGRPWLGGAPIDALSEAVRLRLADATVIESDVRLRYDAGHRMREG